MKHIYIVKGIELCAHHILRFVYTFCTHLYYIFDNDKIDSNNDNKDNDIRHTQSHTPFRAVPCEYLSFQERQRRRTTPSKDISSEDTSS